MRKISLMLALLAGMMLPVTAMAAPKTDAKSKTTSTKKSSKKESTKKKEEPKEEPAPEPVDEGSTFSDEQILLNNQAVEAVSSGNFKKAEQLFNAMLQIGEFNVIWMNLGRTYANQNKCREAKEAYAHVATSPAIKDYPVEVIQETTRGFIRDLEEHCSSKIILNCDPPEMEIVIDGGAEFACSSEPLSLVPGRHSIFAQTSYGFNTIVVETTKNETKLTNVVVMNYKEVALTPEEIRHRSKLYKILGYTFIGGGTAIAAAGFGIWGWAYFSWQAHAKDINSGGNGGPNQDDKLDGKTKDQFNTRQVIGGVIGAFGVAMLITGVTLVIVDAKKYQPQVKMLDSQEENKSAFNFAPVFSPEFSGLTLTGRF